MILMATCAFLGAQYAFQTLANAPCAPVAWMVLVFPHVTCHIPNECAPHDTSPPFGLEPCRREASEASVEEESERRTWPICSMIWYSAATVGHSSLMVLADA